MKLRGNATDFEVGDLITWICFPSFFLWGLGMSTGRHVGFGGIGFGELWFVFISPLILLGFGSNRLMYVLVRLRIYFLSGMVFLSILAMGNLVGAYQWDPSTRDIFIFLRQAFYLILLVPLVTIVAMRLPPDTLLHFILVGVVFSSIYNLANYEFGAFGSLIGQNMIGQQVAMIFPFALYMIWASRRMAGRLLYFMITALLVITSFFSLSKGSWVSILLSSALFAFLYISRKKIQAFLYLGILALLIVGCGYFFFYEAITNVVATEITSARGSGSNEQRWAAVLSGVVIALTYPFGIGGSHYPEAAELADVGLLWIMPDPHNTFAHAASWSGVVGFIFFCIIFFYPAYLVIKSRKLLGARYLLYVPLLAGVYFFANTSGEHLTQPAYWALSALVFGDVLKRRQDAQFSVRETFR